jgi:methylphosphotriester-DNA--protein-cysteine methyltransferase
MEEFLENAKEELKRADHLIYVSLKYTRTVDIIKSSIERLVSAYESVIEGLLERAKNKKKIEQIPMAVGVKAETLKRLYPKKTELADYLNFYVLLRKLSKASFTRAREYRRHVTMTAFVDERQIEVNIDIISEYYKRVVQFVEYVEENITR